MNLFRNTVKLKLGILYLVLLNRINCRATSYGVALCGSLLIPCFEPSYAVGIAGGSYIARTDPLRNIMPMLLIVRKDAENQLHYSQCSGILLSSKNNYPILVTAAHCIWGQEIPGQKSTNVPIFVKAYLPRIATQPYIEHKCFGNPAMTLPTEPDYENLELTDCILDGNKINFEPNNNSVVTLAAMAIGSHPNYKSHHQPDGMYFIPPRSERHNQRADLVAIRLNYIQNNVDPNTLSDLLASSAKLIKVEANDWDPSTKSKAYGWAQHNDQTTRNNAYGKLVADSIKIKLAIPATLAIFEFSSATTPEKQISIAGDSGGPILFKNATPAPDYSLIGIISGVNNDDPTKNYAVSLINTDEQEWLQKILENDGDPTLINKLPDYKDQIICGFGKKCLKNW